MFNGQWSMVNGQSNDSSFNLRLQTVSFRDFTMSNQRFLIEIFNFLSKYLHISSLSSTFVGLKNIKHTNNRVIICYLDADKELINIVII